MSDRSGTVRVRFTTARASQCGCHFAGLVYELPAAFAAQVVKQERCAEYVSSAGLTSESEGRQSRKKA